MSMSCCVLIHQLQARSGDANVATIGPGSLLQAGKLEEEANTLRTQLVTQLYALDDPALLHPIINTFPALVKGRPSLAPLLVSSMAAWVPSAMEAARRPPMQIRAVEKTLRAVMVHIADPRKHPALVGFSAQLHDALSRQKQRMEQAWIADTEERRARRARMASGSLKHPLEAEAESSTGAAKRARLEVMPGTGDGRGGLNVDVSQFALEPVVEAVMAGLSVVTDDLLVRAFENARAAILENAPDAVRVLAPSLFKEDVKVEEEAIVNPLDMELDDEELLVSGSLICALTIDGACGARGSGRDCTHRRLHLTSTRAASDRRKGRAGGLCRSKNMGQWSGSVTLGGPENLGRSTISCPAQGDVDAASCANLVPWRRGQETIDWRLCGQGFWTEIEVCTRVAQRGVAGEATRRNEPVRGWCHGNHERVHPDTRCQGLVTIKVPSRSSRDPRSSDRCLGAALRGYGEDDHWILVVA